VGCHHHQVRGSKPEVQHQLQLLKGATAANRASLVQPDAHKDSAAYAVSDEAVSQNCLRKTEENCSEMEQFALIEAFRRQVLRVEIESDAAEHVDHQQKANYRQEGNTGRVPHGQRVADNGYVQKFDQREPSKKPCHYESDEHEGNGYVDGVGREE